MSHDAHAPRRISLLNSPLVTPDKPPHMATPPIHEVYPTPAPSTGAAASYFGDQGQAYMPANPGDDAAMFETPQFQRHEEATTIELFYDLFFVANLTTFTSLHKINRGKSLQSYAGFFCILWFTWCQVSLFDVRFVADSILERLAKACQFGVMIGLAVAGPNFDPTDQKNFTFQTIAIILAISRVVLAFQYLVVLIHVRSFKKSKTPTFLMAALYLASGLIYGLTWFGFKKGVTQGRVYVIWYIVAVVETMINVAISSKWKVLSFKGTHLVQRMSLLTLIILGEGIIVICKSISKIVQFEDGSAAFTTSTLASITCAVIITYLLYMLYFDWYNHHHFGSIRAQFWAILHFPLHLALVLAVEGGSQFIVWRKLVEVLAKVDLQFWTAITTWDADPTAGYDALQQSLNDTTTAVFEAYPPSDSKVFDDTQGYITQVGDMQTSENATLTAIDDLYTTVQNSLFDSYGIKSPKEKYSVSSANDKFNKNLKVVRLVYIYFFVASGLTLILLNTLHLLAKPKRTLTQNLRIVLNYLLGVMLCMISLLIYAQDAWEFYATSSGVLSTVAGTLAFVLIVNHSHRFWRKEFKDTHQHEKH